MSDILKQICDKRLQDVQAAAQQQPLPVMRQQAEAKKGEQRGFTHALKTAQGPALITEIKKASPSAGTIREGAFDPAALAADLEQAGATALSVLTEPERFEGSLSDMQAARNACVCPVLRKDFIVDEWQVYETAAAGADAILLIVAALSKEQLHDYHTLARELGLDVLVEIHSLEEMERAVRIDSLDMIGVNNRNLKTLAIDTTLSKQLYPLIPEGFLAISESGISNSETLFSLYHQGYKGFLIGHALMQETIPSAAVAQLLGR